MPGGSGFLPVSAGMETRYPGVAGQVRRWHYIRSLLDTLRGVLN